MTAGRALVCWVVVVALVVPSGVAGAPTPHAESGGVFQQQFDADSVLLGVSVAENGSAQWTVRYRIAIETENETAAFESLQADIRDNESAFLSGFESRMQSTVAAAENATGRAMSASGFDIETSQQPVSQSGFVTYSFRWSGFAVVDGDRLRIGDAISGLFLDSQTTLTIGWPSEYVVRQVSPNPDDQGETSVTWEGRLSFTSTEPRLVVGPPPGLLAEWWPFVVGGGLLVVLVGGGLVWYRRREDSPLVPPLGGGDVAGGTVTDSSQQSSSDTGDSSPPAELLSNEEQVLQLVEDRGGRMKQQDVVSELDWTEAKTSQVINGMQDDGDLEVFRIGRENVLKLPDEDDSE